MQFYATDEEIADWLVEKLPGQYAPYVVLGEQWASPHLAVHAYALDDVATSFSADRPARHWIKSGVLSPELDPREIRRPDDMGKLSFSGLIAIRVTDEFGGRIEPASMTMVDRIRHETTGEERRQPEYLRIFERCEVRCANVSSSRLRTGRARNVQPSSARSSTDHLRNTVLLGGSTALRRDATPTVGGAGLCPAGPRVELAAGKVQEGANGGTMGFPVTRTMRRGTS